MTSNYWQISERLLNIFLPTFILLSAFCCFVLFSIWLSHYQKKAGVLILLILLLNILVFTSMMVYTKDYRQLKPNITYKNRDYDTTVYKKSSFSNRFIKGYSQKDIKETLEFPFYSKIETDSNSVFEYLGKDEYLYFFKKESIIYSLDANKNLISFEDNTSQEVTIKEIYAQLNDDSFTSLGFKELVGPTIDKIVIANESSHKNYHPDSTTTKLVPY